MEAGKSTDHLAELLRVAATNVGAILDADQLARLATHFRLLLQWNIKINLSSVREPEEIAARHFGESLFLSRLLPAPATMIDVGSGAGFPGMPLHVAWSPRQTILLEPNQKKATFLKEVIRQSNLAGIKVLTERLQAAAADTLVRAELVTMRAVAVDEATLADLRGLLLLRGKLALFLGEEDAQKIARSKQFDWQPSQPIPDSQRRVILIGHP